MTLVSLSPAILENTLPSPEELRREIPLTEKQAGFIQRSRESVEDILNGWDDRKLLIAGPCSIHDVSSALDYAERFKRLADEVADKFFLVLRSYFEKPRTIVGWKGFFYDPDLDGSYNVAKGATQSRQLLSDLTDMGIPVGSELLEMNSAPYYSDFLSWGCIGARTSSSPLHRQLAASLNFPIGFKNSVDGNIDHAIHGILAAASAHTFLGINLTGQVSRIQAEGNALCHIVLRGSLSGPNYAPYAVKTTVQKCRELKVRDKLVIDCSHDNCGKRHGNQIRVFQEVLEQMQQQPSIVGVMLESHLYEGAQPISADLKYGISVTDPCIDWVTTERLILAAAREARLA